MKILTKEDFKFDKEFRYWSYKEEHGFEIALEPCFNGFDVGLYRIGAIGPLRNKECTNEKGYGSYEFITNEIHGIQDRRPETWKHALRIANRFYRSLLNYIRLRKLKLVDIKEGEVDPMLAEIEIEDEIHGISPKGRI